MMKLTQSGLLCVLLALLYLIPGTATGNPTADTVFAKFNFTHISSDVTVRFSDMRGMTSCRHLLGWLIHSGRADPIYYSVRHHSWVFIPGPKEGTEPLWLFDYASGDWFLYN